MTRDRRLVRSCLVALTLVAAFNGIMRRKKRLNLHKTQKVVKWVAIDWLSTQSMKVAERTERKVVASHWNSHAQEIFVAASVWYQYWHWHWSWQKWYPVNHSVGIVWLLTWTYSEVAVMVFLVWGERFYYVLSLTAQALIIKFVPEVRKAMQYLSEQSGLQTREHAQEQSTQTSLCLPQYWNLSRFVVLKVILFADWYWYECDSIQ